jgi:hypothetical protein
LAFTASSFSPAFLSASSAITFAEATFVALFGWSETIASLAVHTDMPSEHVPPLAGVARA